MQVSYSKQWDGTEAAHLSADDLALAERLLVERHVELCRERGIEPLDTTDCVLTVWGSYDMVSLCHDTEGIIAKVKLPSANMMKEYAEKHGYEWMSTEDAASEGFVTDSLGAFFVGVDNSRDDFVTIAATHDDGLVLVGAESSSGEYQVEAMELPDNDLGTLTATIRAMVHDASALV